MRHLHSREMSMIATRSCFRASPEMDRGGDQEAIGVSIEKVDEVCNRLRIFGHPLPDLGCCPVEERREAPLLLQRQSRLREGKETTTAATSSAIVCEASAFPSSLKIRAEEVDPSPPMGSPACHPATADPTKHTREIKLMVPVTRSNGGDHRGKKGKGTTGSSWATVSRHDRRLVVLQQLKEISTTTGLNDNTSSCRDLRDLLVRAGRAPNARVTTRDQAVERSSVEDPIGSCNENEEVAVILSSPVGRDD